ncbi:MAG: T9SS type A sorting domain-containing protein [Bacteroidetes bacterium]|nr:T9SS type A sorting domain-containing protein [Bacteroidota bacterium]
MHQLRSQGSRIPYFSNPNVSYIGKPTGTSINNNAQKLRDTASTIASFRTGDLLRAIILAKASGACSGDPFRIGSSVSGGIGSYSYQWAASTNGITYIDAGSSKSYSTMMPPSQDLYLKLTVTSGIQQYTDFEYIENIDGSSYCGLTKVFKEKEILTQKDQFPVAFILNEAYPNPFNPSTSITYGIPESGDIRLAVYDLWGRQVSELVNGYRSAGYHSITFDASHLPSGVYL